MVKRAIVLAAAVAALGAGAAWLSGCGGELPPLPDPPELGHGPVGVPAAFKEGGAAQLEIVDARAPAVCDPPCDDGNPCTVDECQGGACVYPDDTELPVCADGAAICVSGECCAAPKCFDKGACVDACPGGATCNASGICEQIRRVFRRRRPTRRRTR